MRITRSFGLRAGLAGLLSLIGLWSVGCQAPSVTASPEDSTSEWTAYSDPHLTVYSQITGSRRGELENDVKWARDVAAYFVGFPLRTNAPPARFFMVGNRRDHWTYAATRDRNFSWSENESGSRYLLDGRRRFGISRFDLFEAITHDQLRRAGAPVWFQYGFGAIVETLDIRNGHLVVGEIDPLRVKHLMAARNLSVHEVLEPGRLAEMAPADRRGHEALAWLMVHYLTLDFDGKTGQSAATRLAAYTDAMKQGAIPSEALEMAWGITANQLSHRIRATFIGSFPTLRISLEKVPRATWPGEAVVLDAAQIQTQLGDLFASFDDLDRAKRAYRRALDRGARPGPTWGQIARVVAREGHFHEALQYAERAMGRDPEAPSVLTARGLVRMRTAAGSRGPHRRNLIEQAQEDLRSALAHAPSEPVTLWAYGVSWFVLEEAPDQAINALETAHAISPSNSTIRLALLEGYALSGRLRDARRMAGSLLSQALDREALRAIEERMLPLAHLEDSRRSGS